MNISFVLRGAESLSTFARRLVTAAAAVEVLLPVEQKTLAESIKRIYGGYLRVEAPIGKRKYTDRDGHQHPGHLRDHLKAKIVRVGTGLVVAFESDASYTRFVIEGTKAHVIVPRHGRVLAFQGANGQTVVAARVHHPGTKANPFPGRAWSTAQPAVRAALALAGRNLLVSFNP